MQCVFFGATLVLQFNWRRCREGVTEHTLSAGPTMVSLRTAMLQSALTLRVQF